MPKAKQGAEHSNQLHRLNRIEGQVKGLSKMIEDHRYCIDIVTQIKAIKAALSAVETNVIEEHLNHCVYRAINSKSRSETDEMLSEIKNLLKKANK